MLYTPQKKKLKSPNTKLRGGQLSSEDRRLLNEILASYHPKEALHLASASRAPRNDEQTWWSLSKYKDPNNGRTHLMYASLKGDLERAKFLIDHGADVNATDKKGYTSLIYAILNGNLNVATLLLDRGANVNAARTNDGVTSLMIASEFGHLEIARRLLDRGANVNAARTNDGMTSLMWASLNGHLEIAHLLLDQGANVNAAKTNDGMTSLLFASQGGYLELVRLLLDRGANVNAVDIYGNNSLKKAKNNKIVQLLKEYGATI